METELPKTKSHHSSHSPSSLKTLEVCPYYESIPDDHEDYEEHETTTDGTDIHNWIEVELSDPDGPFDEETETSWERVENDPSLRELGQWCIDTLDNEIFAFMEVNDSEDWEIYLEQRVHTPFPTCYGRADVLMVNQRTGQAFIVDWKTGFNYQGDAEDNIQGQAYVLGTLKDFPEVTRVTVFFVYPRLKLTTYAEYDRERDWKPLVDRIIKIIGPAVRAKDGIEPQPDYVLDVDNCEYCHLKGRCKAWTSEVKDMVPTFGKSIVPSGLQRPKTWDLTKLANDPEELGKVLTIMDGLDTYRSAAKSLAREMTQKDMEIPGYRKVNMSGKFTVTDAAKALDGLTPQEVAAVTTIKGPDLAKMNAAKWKVSETEARKRMIEAHVAHPGKPFFQLRRMKQANKALKS